MSATIPQPILTAPGGREPIPGGREPAPSGAPPGAPPEAPPFQSALETESARTATAEGQQQSHSENSAPAGAEANTTDPSDTAGRVVPHHSPQPTPHRVGHHRPVLMPARPTASATSASPPPTPTGNTPLLAGALPGRGTPTAEPGTEATAGTGLDRDPAALDQRFPGRLDTQLGSPAARAGSSAADTEGDTAPVITAVHGEAALPYPASPTSPAGPAGGALAVSRDGTPTAGALAAPPNGTPLAGALASPNGTPTTGALATPLNGTPLTSALAAPPSGTPTASALGAAPQATPSAGGTQAPATSAAPYARGLTTALGHPAGASVGGVGSTNADGGSSASAGGGNGWAHSSADHAAEQMHLRSSTSDLSAHDKLWVPDPAQTSTDSADGTGSGGDGLPESALSPLLLAATEGTTEGPPAELGAVDYGVGLQEAIESLHGTIQLAARQGLSQARISLQPEELGEIRINLTQTAQGLLARVTAQSPAAAQALAAAHAQLRQSLSSLGINLTRLDIGHHDSSTQSGGADPRGASHSDLASGEGHRAKRAERSTTLAASPDLQVAPADAPASAPTTPSPGALIDVLV
jgi:flagellar hook-length control protein FliK